MVAKVSTFLMFEGNAEQAMNFYVSLFDDAAVTSLRRYGPGEPGKEGTVTLASFRLKQQNFMCIDSYVTHPFTFTPATSIFLECDSEAEVEELFGRLSEGGQVLMPLDAYPFSRKFAWVVDRFGISWQVNLPND